MDFKTAYFFDILNLRKLVKLKYLTLKNRNKHSGNSWWVKVLPQKEIELREDPWRHGSRHPPLDHECARWSFKKNMSKFNSATHKLPSIYRQVSVVFLEQSEINNTCSEVNFEISKLHWKIPSQNQVLQRNLICALCTTHFNFKT